VIPCYLGAASFFFSFGSAITSERAYASAPPIEDVSIVNPPGLAYGSFFGSGFFYKIFCFNRSVSSSCLSSFFWTYATCYLGASSFASYSLSAFNLI